MAQIKVIYKNQSSGTIEDAFLDRLIAKGEIVAYCNSSKWLSVKNDLIMLKTEVDAENETGV